MSDTSLVTVPYLVVVESFRSATDLFHIHKRDDGAFILSFVDSGAFVVVRNKESIEELSEIIDLCVISQNEEGDEDDIPF